jgi:hypothetical protein
VKLDRAKAEELFRHFYVDSSRAAVYLPSVFVQGTGAQDSFGFEESAQADFHLLTGLLGTGLRRNTPHTYLLGFTEVRSKIEDALRQDPALASEETAEGLREGLNALLAIGSEVDLSDDEAIYRARISPVQPLAAMEYDSPPIDKATANRIARKGDRVLCASLSIETCLVEIRPHIDEVIHHRVYVATLRAKSRLKLIDLTQPLEKVRSADLPPWSDPAFTISAFFEPNQNSYHLTQLLSGFIRRRGYDGIVYPSAMGCIAGREGIWKNIAIFGAPISENRLRVESINRILVKRIINDFELGPAWDAGDRGNHLAPFLKGWKDRAMR